MQTPLELPATPEQWRSLREQRGLTLPDLGELTGLQVSTLARLEAGVHVTRSTRTLVAAALGLAVFVAPAKAMVA
jgi:transcriptional regulator with XRE-family HTH domain